MFIAVCIFLNSIVSAAVLGTYRSKSINRFTTGIKLHKHHVIKIITHLQGLTLTFIMQQKDTQTDRGWLIYRVLWSTVRGRLIMETLRGLLILNTLGTALIRHR